MGKVEIHGSMLAKKILRHQEKRKRSSPAYTRKRCRLPPSSAPIKTEAKKVSANL
jgi:hypothetical protein